MSTPTTLIEKGEILVEGLKKVKFDINDLLEVCRIKGYFDISEIEYAIMEANGDISILPKEEYRNIKLNDMNINKSQSGLCANVIIDGRIMKNNLANIHKDEKWLYEKIKNTDLSNILLATIDNKDTIKIFLKNKNHIGKEILE